MAEAATPGHHKKTDVNMIKSNVDSAFDEHVRNEIQNVPLQTPLDKEGSNYSDDDNKNSTFAWMFKIK